MPAPTPSTLRLKAKLYEPNSAKSWPVEVEILAEEQQVFVIEANGQRRQRCEIEEFPDRLAGVAEVLSIVFLSDPAKVQRRLEFLDPLPAEVRLPGQRRGFNWLGIVERNWIKFLIPILILLVIAFFAYRLLLNVAADTVVAAIPKSFERQISQATITQMTQQGVIWEPMMSYDDELALMNQAAKIYARQLNMAQAPEVLVKGTDFGANAFAFPGGPIMVTEAMLALEPSDAALRGLIAHEVGHVYGRHSMKQIVRVMGAIVMTTFVFGGEGPSLDEYLIVLLPLVDAAYSRRFEREADRLGEQMLVDAGYQEDGLVEMFRVLNDETGDFDLGWLSSHPSFKERIENSRTNR